MKWILTIGIMTVSFHFTSQAAEINGNWVIW